MRRRQGRRWRCKDSAGGASSGRLATFGTARNTELDRGGYVCVHSEAAAAAAAAAKAPSTIFSVLGACTTIAAVGTDGAAPTHAARCDQDGATTAAAAAAQRVIARPVASTASRSSRAIGVDRCATRHRQAACQAHAHHPATGATRGSLAVVVPLAAAAPSGDREVVGAIH